MVNSFRLWIRQAFGSRQSLMYKSWNARWLTKLLSLLFGLLAIYHSRIGDHLFEKSFDNFEWPSYVDLRAELYNNSRRFPTRLFLNDWAYFEQKYLPPCDRTSNFTGNEFVLIAVKSHIDNRQRRDAIRKTWGAFKEHSGYKIRTVFIVGLREPMTNILLNEELVKYNDVIVDDHVDSYRNNTLKFLSAIHFSYNYCKIYENIVPYALFIDDDYLLIVPNLIDEIKKHGPSERIYMGWRFDTRPFRFILHKHRLSLSEYAYNRFPPYISAGAVLLTRETIRSFYLSIQYIKLFAMDDVYAGILAYLLRIPALHNNQMYFWENSVRIRSSQDIGDMICAHGYDFEHLMAVYKSLRLG